MTTNPNHEYTTLTFEHWWESEPREERLKWFRRDLHKTRWRGDCDILNMFHLFSNVYKAPKDVLTLRVWFSCQLADIHFEDPDAKLISFRYFLSLLNKGFRLDQERKSGGQND